jgi:hypothetical protein
LTFKSLPLLESNFMGKKGITHKYFIRQQSQQNCSTLLPNFFLNTRQTITTQKVVNVLALDRAMKVTLDA